MVSYVQKYISPVKSTLIVYGLWIFWYVMILYYWRKFRLFEFPFKVPISRKLQKEIQEPDFLTNCFLRKCLDKRVLNATSSTMLKSIIIHSLRGKTSSITEPNSIVSCKNFWRKTTSQIQIHFMPLWKDIVWELKNTKTKANPPQIGVYQVGQTAWLNSLT